MTRTNFNKNEYYETEIEPLVNELRSKCNENKIPFFVAFGTMMKDGLFPKGEGIKCTALIPEVLSIDSNDSFFADFINIVNGAQTVYGAPEVLDMDSQDDEDPLEEGI